MKTPNSPMKSLVLSLFSLFLLAIPIVQASSGGPGNDDDVVVENPQKTSEVGLVGHVATTKEVELVKNSGVQWLRTGIFWAGNANACSSRIGFNHDQIKTVKDAHARGLKVFFTLYGTPKCASFGDRQGDGSINDVPKGHLVEQYMVQAVKFYRGMGVRHFGLWNEPNLKQFFEGSVSDVINNIYIPGFRAVREGCRQAGFSDCLIMGPELAFDKNAGEWMIPILKTLKEKNLVFDIITHHNYKSMSGGWAKHSYSSGLDGSALNDAPSLLSMLEDGGYTKANGKPMTEVWITEAGYKLADANDRGELAEQADYIEHVLEEANKRDWITNTFIYQLKNSTSKTKKVFGLTSASGDRKNLHNWILRPAYHRLKEYMTTP